LPVRRRRVVRPPEHLQQLRVGDDPGVIGQLRDLGVPGRAGAYLVVAGVLDAAAAVAGDDRLHAVELLEDRLGTPEAAGAEGGLLQASGQGPGRLGRGRTQL